MLALLKMALIVAPFDMPLETRCTPPACPLPGHTADVCGLCMHFCCLRSCLDL
jgi:hypothetical protein